MNRIFLIKKFQGGPKLLGLREMSAQSFVHVYPPISFVLPAFYFFKNEKHVLPQIRFCLTGQFEANFLIFFKHELPEKHKNHTFISSSSGRSRLKENRLQNRNRIFHKKCFSFFKKLKGVRTKEIDG